MEHGRLASPPPEVAHLLDSYFHDADDLSSLEQVQGDLKSECHQLESKLQNARRDAYEAAGDGSLQLGRLAMSLEELTRRIEGLRDGRASRVELVHDLSNLAAEVARVEQVRGYVEAALQLERLVGDLEDAVFTAASTTPVVSRGGWLGTHTSNPSSSAGQSSSRLASAVNILDSIEKLMGEIAKCRPQWQRLLAAVDVRVDRAAAALRPVAVADHRAVINSVRWPPPLSTSREDESGKTNPLLEMQGEVKWRYKESFLSLSTLQAVQLKRRYRIRGNKDWKGGILDMVLGNKRSEREPLWSIEELVAPISTRVEPHFKKWLHKPELVFALAYRVAQEHVDVVDGFLQPMLDETSLGYSAREEWVSAFVTMVAEHLRKWALPALLRDLDDESLIDQVSTVWLHTVDQTLAFDRKMQGLAVTGIGFTTTGNDEGFAGVTENVLGVRQPCISVFADRADWMELWAKLELADVQRKLKPLFENEIAWKVNAADSDVLEDQPVPLPSSTGEFRPPLGAYKVISAAWSVTERCRTLPEASQRLTFVRATARPVLDSFLGELWQRCQESEALTALSDEGSMSKVAVCLNAARYCEHTLKEWGEDIFFLELKLAELHDDEHAISSIPSERDAASLSQIEGSVFDAQLRRLAQFRSSWLGKLGAVVIRGFDARTRDYLRNKRKWSEESLEYTHEAVDVEPSASLVEALAVLQSQLRTLKNALDQSIFVELWQRLIPALDQLLFQGVVLSGARFSDNGGQQFACDARSLFQIFRPYCARPASFFSGLSDAIRLLSMRQQEASALLKRLTQEEEDDEPDTFEVDFLRHSGIRKMAPFTAKRILSSRISIKG